MALAFSHVRGWELLVYWYGKGAGRGWGEATVREPGVRKDAVEFSQRHGSRKGGNKTSLTADCVCFQDKRQTQPRAINFAITNKRELVFSNLTRGGGTLTRCLPEFVQRHRILSTQKGSFIEPLPWGQLTYRLFQT